VRPEGTCSAAASQPVRTRRAFGAVGGLFVLAFAAAGAQSDTTARAQDTVVARARQLVQAGKDADGRRLLDSLLVVTPTEDARFAEVLYWQGVYGATAADAERAYRRLLIEAPMSPRAEDALLRLATLEQARGDRRSASDHLQRFLLSYPNSPSRPRVSVQLVRLLFDQGPSQLARACDVLHTARAEVPASSVELRNQLEAQVPRCAYADMQAPAAAPPTVTDSTPTVPAVPSTTADTTKRAAPSQAAAPTTAPAPAAASPVPAPQTTPPSPPAASAAPTTAPNAAPTVAFYSVQLAAYDSQESATRLVQQLAARGIEARVDGTSPPYRVRVGKYSTRADAVKAAADLKGKGHSGFITLVGPPAK
jgi:cell division septation protein DedD